MQKQALRRGYLTIATVCVAALTIAGFSIACAGLGEAFEELEKKKLSTSGKVTRVLIGGSTSIQTNQCGLFTVEGRDDQNQVVTLTQPVEVTLTDDSGTGSFYSDNGCGASIGTITLPAGTATVSVYFRDSNLGSPTLTVSAAGAVSGSLQISIVSPP